ncbi:MAG: lamin tail domain-containing protein [Phycisphaerae bacterium]|nr:lamin tail domain-containing protein [Phycisphaerae bacterium]
MTRTWGMNLGAWVPLAVIAGVCAGLGPVTAQAHDMHIVITEFNYHPYGNRDEHEFLELYNRGSEAVDLSAWRIVSGVDFVFPAATFIQPGAYLVVAKNPSVVASSYGISECVGPFEGKLANEGEMIQLVNAQGVLVERVHYSDEDPWPERPDGDGPTLERVSVQEPGDRPWNWLPSRIIGGTPGRSNSVNTLAEPARDVVINEVASTAGGGWIELYNRSGGAMNLEGYGLTAAPFPGSVYSIGSGTVVPPGGRWSVDRASLPFPILDNVESRISLLMPDGRLIDTVTYRTRASMGSIGRVPDGGDDTYVMTSPSRDEPNHVTLTDSIVITEIMYHPAPPSGVEGQPRLPYDRNEEFIEIHNRSAAAVTLTGWKLTGAVDYDLPSDLQIDAGAYLVVARDVTTFKSKYSSDVMVVGGFTDVLADGHEHVVLRDPLNNVADEVRYADDGSWPAEPDGEGPSLELIHADADNNVGSAWRASTMNGGTPGKPNSTAVADPAPVIRSVRHDPPVPTSAQPVTVTAGVTDTGGVSEVRLWYVVDPGTAFASVCMTDDGAHGDGAAGDGVYGATLPAQPAGSIVRFYIDAVDNQSHAATAPGFPPAYARSGPSDPTFLYQVDDRTWPANLPLYRVVMTGANLHTLRTRDVYSNVDLDGTFVCDSTVIYNVGVRYRGKGSRNDAKKSFRVQFHDDGPYGNLEDLNLNAHEIHQQYIGQEFFSYVDLPVHRTRLVLMTLNNDLDMTSLADPNTYLQVESVDESYVERVFEEDAGGNLYRGEQDGDLSYHGTSPADYRSIYLKETNEDLDDYRDVIALTDLLTNTGDAQFADVVRANVDIDEWTRFFAAMTVVTNDEGGICLDDGDDYYLYHRPTDNKWVLVPWDFDSVWNLGSTRSPPNQRLFRAGINDSGSVTLPIVRRILRHPDFAPIYYREIRQLMAYSFHPEIMAGRIANLRRYSPRFAARDIDDVEAFITQRRSYLASMIPPALTVSVDEAMRARVDYIVDGDEWRFFRGTSEPSVTALDWTRLGFDDAGWEKGQSGFGYGDSDDRTMLSDMQNGFTSVYIRKKFTMDDPAAVPELMLSVWYDDGFVAYINGREVKRHNAPGTIDQAVPRTQTATADHEAADYGWEVYNLTSWLTAPDTPLVKGENVLAIHGLNRTSGSTDFSLRPILYVPGIVPPRLMHIDDGEQWSFIRGLSEPSAEPLGWTQPGFGETGWESGLSGFGFGDSDDRTPLNDMRNSYLSVYIRKRFTISDLLAIDDLLLEMWYDDGFVAYLNGQYIAHGSVTLPASRVIAYNDDTAAASHEQAGFEAFDLTALLTVPNSPLRQGENVLAIHGLNASYESTDFSLRPRLSSSGRLSSTISDCGAGLVTTADKIHISGTAPAGDARWVQVDSRTAGYLPVSWDNNPLELSAYTAEVELQPGPNDLSIVALNADFTEVARRQLTVTRAVDSSTPVGGVLDPLTTWTQAGGPYHITSDVVVPASGLLTIEAGTSLLFDENAVLVVRGRLLASGTADAPIRLGPFVCGRMWSGLVFLQSEGESRLDYCDLFDGSTPLYEGISYAACVNVVGSSLRMEHGLFDRMAARGIDAVQNASLSVFNSAFRNTGGAIRVDHSCAELEELSVVHVIGASGAIVLHGDCTTPSSVRCCVLETGGGDGIDLQAGSALVEGNTILGMAGKGLLLRSGRPIVRGNVVANCPTGMTLADGVNAAISHCTIVGGQTGIDLLEINTGQGGGHAEINSTIVWDFAVASIRLDTSSSVNIQMSDVAGGFAGTGNLATDPLFVGAGTGSYYLAPTSPCVGTGVSGTDMGALPAADNPVFQVVINEWMAQNSTIPDPQGEYDDWFELYNRGPRPVNVGGLFLSDHTDTPGLWRIPSNTILQPRQFLLVWADRDVTDVPGLHADFALEVNGEEIGLYLQAGGAYHVVDRVTFGDQTSDRSMGRTTDGAAEMDVLERPTPGESNNPPPPLTNGVGLRLVAPPRFLPSADVPLRVEVLTPSGAVDRNFWTGQILLSTDPPGITIAPASVEVINGMASGQFRLSGAGKVRLTATFEERRATVELVGLDAPTYRSVSGSLASGTTVWGPADGIVRVTGDLTVPSGAVLQIQAGTMVMLNASTDITVQGSVQCAGTLEAPVLITAADSAAAWGQILHTGAASTSAYHYAFLTHAGDATGVGHTGAGPVIRGASGATVSFADCSFIDELGKGLYADSCHLTFDRCLFARMIMGPEVTNTDTAMTDTFFLHMLPGGDVTDNDGLYLNGSGTMTVRRCVFAFGGDDGIDTLNSTPLIEQCIVRHFEDKGLSVFSGEVRIRDSALLSNSTGISAKGNNTDVFVDNCTLYEHPIGLEARDKFGEPNNIIHFYVNNTIIWASPEVVRTDYQPENIVIAHGILDPSVPWPGIGNLTTDPRFRDVGGYDFRLKEDSPGINSGDPAFAPATGEADLDGRPRVLAGRVDRGAYESVPALGPDLDADGDVDLKDYGLFAACVSGPWVPLAMGCERPDFDGDQDVDQSDFGIFQGCYSGSDMPANPGCTY